jgi:hypothetical protein
MIAAAAVLATGPSGCADAVAAGDLHLEQVEAITESLAKLPAVDRPAAADRLVAEAASWMRRCCGGWVLSSATPSTPSLTTPRGSAVWSGWSGVSSGTGTCPSGRRVTGWGTGSMGG